MTPRPTLVLVPWWLALRSSHVDVRKSLMSISGKSGWSRTSASFRASPALSPPRRRSQWSRSAWSPSSMSFPHSCIRFASPVKFSSWQPQDTCMVSRLPARDPDQVLQHRDSGLSGQPSSPSEFPNPGVRRGWNPSYWLFRLVVQPSSLRKLYSDLDSLSENLTSNFFRCYVFSVINVYDH